jgi:glycosyltransferase involved in cell wall biosynthesis
MTPPTISVVVPSFNQASFIEATITSLLTQGDPALEVLVVDGCSTDGSLEIIRRYADRLHWWVSEKDNGQSHALNKGFARATGEWLCWLNSDDMLLPGALHALREAVSGDPARQWWIGGGRFVDARARSIRDYSTPVGLTSAVQLNDWRRFWFAQPSTFFSRALFDAAGGRVREDLHYAMDLDLWLRFLQQAAPGFIEAKLSAYRLHDSAKTAILTPAAEIEIVRLLIDTLGLDAAMARIECVAADRRDLELKYRRILPFAQPFISVYSRLKKLGKHMRGVGS